MTTMDNCTRKVRVEPLRVIVRCRPMNIDEQQSGYSKIVNVLPSTRTVQIFESPEDKVGRLFTFDAVYDTISSQENLYTESVLKIIKSVMRGYNATILAYGQTGSGKTFTMEGNRESSKLKGIIPRSFEQIFSHVKISSDTDYSVRASYVEIYNEELRDLLENNTEKQFYKLREDSNAGVFVTNLRAPICRSVKDLERVMRIGNQNRQTGFTSMNEHSSRSHAIFTITIQVRRFDTEQIRTGKLNLVDLAGSERQSKTNSTDERLKEASKINLSLSALGNVILALGKKQHHIPYRDSKLTRLLQDSLGGNAKTLMIANIGPASYNKDETLMTLRYASRARRITNRPTINESSKDSMIRLYKEEIRRLKHLIAQKKTKSKHKNSKLYSADEDDLDNTPIENYSMITDRNLKANKDDIQRTYFEDFSDDEILPNTLTVNDKRKLYQGLDKNTSIDQVESDENNEIAINHCRNLIEKQINCNTKTVGKTSNENNLQNYIEQLSQSSQENKLEIDKFIQLELELKLEISKQEKSTEKLTALTSNLEHEVELRKALMKLYCYKLTSTKTRTQKIMDEFNVDRRELEVIREELLKACKFNKIIIENFIPDEKVDSFFNKNNANEWMKTFVDHTDNSTHANFKSLEDIICRDKHVKCDWYRENELLYLEPISCGRKTNDYFTYGARPLVKSMLDTLGSQVKKLHRPIRSRAELINDKSVLLSNKIYPQPRGLVPK